MSDKPQPGQIETFGSPYMEFHFDADASKGKKTEVWNIVNKRHGFKLGEIRWSSRWRKYSFYPQPHTIFDAKCLMLLADICRHFTARHMAERRASV